MCLSAARALRWWIFPARCDSDNKRVIACRIGTRAGFSLTRALFRKKYVGPSLIYESPDWIHTTRTVQYCQHRHFVKDSHNIIICTHKVWSLRQQNYLNYPTFTEYFVITWLRLRLWWPLFVGPLFGRTCWTCLNAPLCRTSVLHTRASHEEMFSDPGRRPLRLDQLRFARKPRSLPSHLRQVCCIVVQNVYDSIIHCNVGVDTVIFTHKHENNLRNK